MLIQDNYARDIDTLNYISSTRAVLQITGIEGVTFTCTDYNLPGLELPAAIVNTPFTDMPYRGDKLQFNPLNISFIVSAKLENWRALYNWIVGLAAPTDPREFCNKPQEFAQGILHLYSAQNNKFAEVIFQDLIPVSLGDITFTSQQSQNDEIIVQATFNYMHYKFKFGDEMNKSESD